MIATRISDYHVVLLVLLQVIIGGGSHLSNVGVEGVVGIYVIDGLDSAIITDVSLSIVSVNAFITPI